MVTTFQHGRRGNTGSLLIELIVAVAIITIAMFPIVDRYMQVERAVRRSYQHAVAMELIDGEMEILLAGQWREYPVGTRTFTLPGDAATNLPPGRAVLTISSNRVRLEWVPDKIGTGGKITREAIAK